MTLKITSAQVVETSVNNKNNKIPSQEHLHPQDHTCTRYLTPGFKPLTIVLNLSERKLIHRLLTTFRNKQEYLPAVQMKVNKEWQVLFDQDWTNVI